MEQPPDRPPATPKATVPLSPLDPLHEMRRRGVRIDVAAAEKARDKLLRERHETFVELWPP